MSEKEEVKPLKVKAKKPSIKTKSNKVHKLDLSKKEEVKEEIKEDAVQESSTTKVDVREPSGDGKEVGETHEEKIVATKAKEEKEVVSPISEITEEAAKETNCSNCVAFDISPRMEECMPGVTSDEDGRLGYCWMHHFKCHSARSCRTWAKGGPIEKDSISYDWQERNDK